MRIWIWRIEQGTEKNVVNIEREATIWEVVIKECYQKTNVLRSSHPDVFFFTDWNLYL